MNTRLLRVVGFLKTLIMYFTDFVQYNVRLCTASSRGICNLITSNLRTFTGTNKLAFKNCTNFWVAKALMSL